jgi:hypothetical protein
MDLSNYLSNYLLSKNNSRDLEKFNHLIIKLNNTTKLNSEKNNTNIINLIIRLKSLYGLKLDISNNIIYCNKNNNLEIHKKHVISNFNISMLKYCLLDNKSLYKKEIYNKGLLNFDPIYEKNNNIIYKNLTRYKNISKINFYNNILFEESSYINQFEKENYISNIKKNIYTLKHQTNFYKDFTISDFNYLNNINNDEYIRYNYIEYSFNINNIQNNYFTNNIFIREYYKPNTTLEDSINNIINKNNDLSININNDVEKFLSLFKNNKHRNKNNIDKFIYISNTQVGINLNFTENNNIISNKLNDIIKYTTDLQMLLDEL